MAYDDVKESLISTSEDASLPKDKNALQRRRYRRTSPSTENSLDQNGSETLPLQSSYSLELTIKRVIVLLSAYLGVGTLCFYLVGDQLLGKKTNYVLDALYFSVVTMTTVGYGDLVPNSTLAKLLASLYVFTGMALVGFALSKAADYMVEKQEILLVRAVHMNEKFGTAELLKEIELNKVKYKFLTAFILLVFLNIFGVVVLCVSEDLKFVDALYCVFSTITTLGYGDESFSTAGGRLFAVFWILSSTICLAQVFLYLAEMYTENRQRYIVKCVLARKLTRSDLEVADLDQDKIVSAAEFVLYKLKEMGKINQEDISVLLQNFKKLDVDQSGTLTSSDLIHHVSS